MLYYGIFCLSQISEIGILKRIGAEMMQSLLLLLVQEEKHQERRMLFIYSLINKECHMLRFWVASVKMYCPLVVMR